VKGGGGITGHGIGPRTGSPHAGRPEFIDVKAAGNADAGNRY